MSRIVEDDIKTLIYRNEWGGFSQARLEFEVNVYDLDNYTESVIKEVLVDRMEDAILRYMDKIKQEREERKGEQR